MREFVFGFFFSESSRFFSGCYSMHHVAWALVPMAQINLALRDHRCDDLPLVFASGGAAHTALPLHVLLSIAPISLRSVACLRTSHRHH
jgi:hypothetical protein